MTHQGAGAANPPFWWTFALGGIHLTMLSSEHDYSAGSSQRAFAEATLLGGGINRSLTPCRTRAAPLAFAGELRVSSCFEPVVACVEGY